MWDSKPFGAELGSWDEETGFGIWGERVGILGGELFNPFRTGLACRQEVLEFITRGFIRILGGRAWGENLWRRG